MKKLLTSPTRNYTKLAEFAKVVISVDAEAPPVQFWNVRDLFRYWGIASEYIHFVGPHSVTYSETVWIAKAIARLDAVLNPLWRAVTTTIGH